MAKTNTKDDQQRECDSRVSHLNLQIQLMKKQCARQINFGRALGFGAGTIVGTLIGAAIWRRRPAPTVE